MDEAARLQLMSIIDRIPLEDKRAIAEMPRECAILLHHGLGTWIRNLIRSGELSALFRWSCDQVPDAGSLDDMAWPIIFEVWKALRPEPCEGAPQSPSPGA